MRRWARGLPQRERWLENEGRQKAVVTAWPEDYARYGLELLWPILGSVIAVLLWGMLPLAWLIVLGAAEIIAVAAMIFIAVKLGEYRPKYLFLRTEDGDSEVQAAVALSPWRGRKLTAWTMGLDRLQYHYDVEVHVAVEGRELKVGMPEELWQQATPEERQFLMLTQLIRKHKVRSLWRIGLIRVAVYATLAGLSILNGWLGLACSVLAVVACIRFLPWMVHGINDWHAAKRLKNPEAALSALETVVRESDPSFPKPFLPARIRMMEKRLRLPG